MLLAKAEIRQFDLVRIGEWHVFLLGNLIVPLDCDGVQLLFEPSSSLARSLLFPGFYYVYIYIYI